VPSKPIILRDGKSYQNVAAFALACRLSACHVYRLLRNRSPDNIAEDAGISRSSLNPLLTPRPRIGPPRIIDDRAATAKKMVEPSLRNDTMRAAFERAIQAKPSRSEVNRLAMELVKSRMATGQALRWTAASAPMVLRNSVLGLPAAH
jgi:hypothetical protein